MDPLESPVGVLPRVLPPVEPRPRERERTGRLAVARRGRQRALLALAFASVLASGATAQRRPPAPSAAESQAGQWRMAGRDFGLTRFSPLDQITAENVAGLRPAWSFSTGVLGPHEGSPLVVGTTMFVHAPYPNTVYALDLTAPGAPIRWRYLAPAAARRTAPLTGCCDTGSRGLAWHPSGRLLVPLLTGQLAALSAETGREVWRVRHTDPAAGATLPGAPLVVGDLVIVGTAGAGYGVRGHISAYEVSTGRLVWRGYTTGPDADVLTDGITNQHYSSHQGRELGASSWPSGLWQTGGGTVSGWLSYDPELDLVFHGTDEPAPGNPAQRPGDNKWTSSIIAREAKTGRVRWAYQVTPHDEWGYGAGNENILVDLTVGGARTPALVHFDRNGFAYTIARATGKVLVAQPYGPVNWAAKLDESTGLPVRAPAFAAPPPAPPAPGPGRRPPPPMTSGVCPAAIGGKHLQPAAYSPVTGLFYVPASNLCMDLNTEPVTYSAGRPFAGANTRMSAGPGGNRGRLLAWDASTATVAWEIKEPLAVTSGVLVTAGGLVFYGTMDGWLKAVDHRSGREVWRHKTPSGIVGSPIAFTTPDGRQHIAVYSGFGGWWARGAAEAFPELPTVTAAGGVLTVFSL